MVKKCSKIFNLDMKRDTAKGIRFIRDYKKACSKKEALKSFSKKYKTKVKSTEVY